MIRRILPDYAHPATVISTASLHRAHLPPHDTVHAITLPPQSSIVDPHGSETALKTINKTEDIPGGVGKSSPTGNIVLSNSIPDTPQESRRPLGLTITCVNAVVEVQVVSSPAKQWTLRVIPGAGTDVKAQEQSGSADGVENELKAFAASVAASKGGKAGNDDAGYPTGPMWDVALIQALLTSNGKPVEVNSLL
jgi:hypothetical protein